MAADAIDVREPDLDPLGPRKINTRNACHIEPLSLSLLMFLVRADHPDHAAPADDLALVANAFD
jgi:hypothetical protein